MGPAPGVPASAAIVLWVLAWWPEIAGNPTVHNTFLGAGLLLAIGAMSLLVSTARGRRPLRLTFAARRPHWVQSLAQLGVLLYWGWYFRTVYDFAPYLLAQLAFAYGIDAILSLHRRGAYVLGFGPIPIVFSINLFLWFKPDWFYFQFAMIALGYVAKELIRWNRAGKSAHIFNPSSFPLAVASLLLIVTGTSDLTFGLQIANTQAAPPHIYAVIFLVALPGQILFGVASVTIAAVLSAYLFSQLHVAIFGELFFQDAYIPAAVFLGMHLLVTDPSTSPRTENGRILFGVLYGLGTVAGAAVLFAAGAPGFYDKLLIVPVLNLCVRAIDGRWPAGVPRQGASQVRPPSPMRRNLAVVWLWAVLFAAILVAGGFAPAAGQL
jgi:hypothetical protein